MFLECHKDWTLHSKYNSGGADWEANWAVPGDQDNEECREVESGGKKEEKRGRKEEKNFSFPGHFFFGPSPLSKRLKRARSK